MENLSLTVPTSESPPASTTSPTATTRVSAPISPSSRPGPSDSDAAADVAADEDVPPIQWRTAKPEDAQEQYRLFEAYYKDRAFAYSEEEKRFLPRAHTYWAEYSGHTYLYTQNSHLKPTPNLYLFTYLQVRTYERPTNSHPYIKRGVNWEAEYPNWHQIDARCLRFNKEMIKHSKVIFFIGQENHESWRSFITLTSGDKVNQVHLGSTDFEELNLADHVYGARPAFHTIKSSSGTVKKLVFSSYHSQFCINGSDTRRGAYMDLLWNAALNFAELEVRQYDTFTRGMGLNPTAATRFRCCFVDPETGKRCCATRQYLRYLRKHWDACHSKIDGASWDEILVDELPREVQFALALDPEGYKAESGKAYTNAGEKGRAPGCSPQEEGRKEAGKCSAGAQGPSTDWTPTSELGESPVPLSLR